MQSFYSLLFVIRWIRNENKKKKKQCETAGDIFPHCVWYGPKGRL